MDLGNPKKNYLRKGKKTSTLRVLPLLYPQYLYTVHTRSPLVIGIRRPPPTPTPVASFF